MSATEAIAVAAGLGAIALVARDAFRTVIHPEGRGTASRAIRRALRTATGPLARRPGRAVGVAAPLGMVLTIGAWLAGAAVGWAALYWAVLPDGVIDTVEGRTASGADDALYLSLATLTTLGFGDLVPAGGWLRLLAPAQALFGFALLSASISWVLSIQPALVRLRSSAAFLATLDGPDGARTRPEDLPGPARAALLRDIARRAGTAEGDLDHFSTAYWFEPSAAHLSLAHALPRAERFVTDAEADGDRDVRHAAAQARAAIDRLAGLLGREFLGMPGAATGEVLSAYRAERPHAPPGGR